LAISAGIAELDGIEMTSVSKPSLSNAPLSFAIQTEAMVAEVLK
jgi:hypothetical protein